MLHPDPSTKAPCIVHLTTLSSKSVDFHDSNLCKYVQIHANTVQNMYARIYRQRQTYIVETVMCCGYASGPRRAHLHDGGRGLG
jgi:hypothetical protein